jgi:hypothetical protein
MKKIPQQRKQKLKKKTSNLSLFGYSAIPKAAMVLEGQKLCAFTRKKNDFFLFQVLYSPPHKKLQ